MTGVTAYTKPSVSGEWTVEKLQELSLEQVMELFSSLSAPEFKEMNGEYASDALQQGLKLKHLALDLWLDNPINYGHWLGKAFTPRNEEVGQGYNFFRKYGRVYRKLRMGTRIAPSRFDGKDVFLLDYSAYFTQGKLMVMKDEVRKVQEGLYLGIGTGGYFEKMREIPWPFTLSGPIHEYVGPDRM